MQKVIVHLKTGRATTFEKTNKVKAGKFWVKISHIIRNVERIDYVRATEVARIECSAIKEKEE